MADYTQDDRLAKITTPLGDNKLLLYSMTGSEELSQPFKYEAICISTDHNLNLDSLIGESITVELKCDEKGDSKRYFNGICTEAWQIASTNVFAEYHVVLRPWFALLEHAVDCKVFQKKSVVDIIKSIFSDSSFNDFSVSVTGEYPELPYCVQYNETTADFINRLMEKNGLYYYFKHSDGKHEMTIVDAMSSHSTGNGVSKINWIQNIDKWSLKKAFQTCNATVNAYDFKNPSGNLLSKKNQNRKYSHANMEKYNSYGNSYAKSGDGDKFAEVNLQANQAGYDIFSCTTLLRGAATGYTFSLSDCPRKDQNTDYLIIKNEIQIDNGNYSSRDNVQFRGEISSFGEEDEEPSFNSKLTGMPKTANFRAPQITPKPEVHGIQSATVVGSSGEEIWTDDFRRIKIQFPWDRDGKKDENSSCWVRVATAWAGKNWGALFTPRIGQEVLVQFINGDPDRPLVIGSVYNNDNNPPYPGSSPTKNGIKSHSSSEGGSDNYNEIYFEDKKGEELLYIQAEKDKQILVKNDRTTDIKHDEIYTIENDRTGTVKHDETLTVENNRTRTVNNDEKVTIKNDRNKTVENNEVITIKNDRTSTINNNETHEVKNDRKTTISNDETLTVKNNRNSSITGNEEKKIDGNKTLKIKGKDSTEVTGAQNIKVSQSRSANITSKDSIDAQEITLTGKTKITLKVGGSSVEISNSGIVLKAGASKLNLGMAQAALESVTTSVKGQATATVQGSASAEVKGAMATLSGDAMVTVKGGIAMIN